MGRPRQIKPLAFSAAVVWFVSLLLSLTAADEHSFEQVSSLAFTYALAACTFALGALLAAAALLLFVLAAFHEWREELALAPRREAGRDHYA